MSEVTNACTPAAMASFFSILPEPPHTATFFMRSTEPEYLTAFK